MASPPRYSLADEEERIAGDGPVQESDPLLPPDDPERCRGRANDAGRAIKGGWTAEEDGSGAGTDPLYHPAVNAVADEGGLYGRLTTLYTFHPLIRYTCRNNLPKAVLRPWAGIVR